MRRGGLAKVGASRPQTAGQYEAGAENTEKQVELSCFTAFQPQWKQDRRSKAQIRVSPSDPGDNKELEEIVVSSVTDGDQNEPEDEASEISQESVVQKLASRTVAAIMASVGLSPGHEENCAMEPLREHDGRVKRGAQRKGAWNISPNLPITGGTAFAVMTKATCEQGKESHLDHEREPPVIRRNSTGNMKANVNSENLKATIRRLQSRRFRSPKKGITVTVLQDFLAFLFYMGMSPLKPASAKNMPKWFLRLQNVST